MKLVFEAIRELDILDESIERHETLNSKLFDENNKLKEDVREALLNVKDEFLKDLSENKIPLRVIDVWLVGSNASFNYTDKSDIDLHIIANLDDVCEDTCLLQILYNYVKASFNKRHDISIKGSPVEVYIQDVNSNSVSNGIYSLQEDEWIKFPEQLPEYETDTTKLVGLQDLLRIYNTLDRTNIEQIKSLIDYAYIIRQKGLVEGEFSDGNLSFKEFRNLGHLDELKDLVAELRSKELSLESLQQK